MKKITVIYAVCMFFMHTGRSQDIHFSLFYDSPLNLNPALTGDFQGDWRFVGNIRNQWSSVTVPYETYGISADVPKVLATLPISVGLSTYMDRTGDSKFSTFQFNLAGAYQKQLNSDSTWFVRGGIQLGFTQRWIDYTDLVFDNQFNGYYVDKSLPNGESFNRNSRMYPNFNVGLSSSYKIAKRKSLQGGISLYNLLGNRQTFYNDQTIRLDRRFHGFAKADYTVHPLFDVLPGASLMLQGTFRELLVGSDVRYRLDSNSYSPVNLYAGVWFRTRDAGYVTAGIDYKNWHVHLAYDINLSTLKVASQGRGGIEIAVIYIPRTSPEERLHYRLCPDYL